MTIFINPPYGREIGKLTRKLLDEYSEGGVKAAIALIPVKSDTEWWNELSEQVACWCGVRGRLQFESPNGESGNTGTFASCVALLTEDDDVKKKFANEFSSMGIIWVRKMGEE